MKKTNIKARIIKVSIIVIYTTVLPYSLYTTFNKMDNGITSFNGNRVYVDMGDFSLSTMDNNVKYIGKKQNAVKSSYSKSINHNHSLIPLHNSYSIFKQNSKVSSAFSTDGGGSMSASNFSDTKRSSIRNDNEYKDYKSNVAQLISLKDIGIPLLFTNGNQSTSNLSLVDVADYNVGDVIHPGGNTGILPCLPIGDGIFFLVFVAGGFVLLKLKLQ